MHEPTQPVNIDDLAHRELCDLFTEIDTEHKAASAALAANDMQAWVEHAGRGAELFEKVAHLNGWRETPDA
jgi:hypothetical protein